MFKYKCGICGYLHDETATGTDFSDLDACPLCANPPVVFEKEEDEAGEEPAPAPTEVIKEEGIGLAYPKKFQRHDPSIRHMDTIHKMAVSGDSIIEAMATKTPMPGWVDILILGAQLDPPPLEADEEVNISTVIGKNAAKPMVLGGPAFVSHMSFGALSAETKEALAMGSAMAGTAVCSGEGGILPEEISAAHKYIFEYVPNLYSVTDTYLRAADAIEIKIGQGTKPGMGGHLPGNKVTPEVAKIRNRPVGKDIISPSKFSFVRSRENLKTLVTDLRELSEGRPIGIKIAAGRIEKDLEYCLFAEPDFITIDGRGGGTGASPKLVRDSTGIPTLYALHRARKYLDSASSDVDLIITGGLKVSSDIAKALAMGADAAALATASLMAAACQQYRVCNTSSCPVGAATQNPDLRSRLKVEAAAQRVANFYKVTFDELRTFARLTGHKNLHDMTVEDLATINKEISDYTDIPHV